MTFKPATRRAATLKIGIGGTAGAGKTYSALTLAKNLLDTCGRRADGRARIAVIDSERGSASLYADLVPFDANDLDETTPQAYMAALDEAAAAGYEVVIVDSWSHSWQTTLENVDKMGGWVKAGKIVSPLLARLVNKLLAYPGHAIVTLRMKSDVVIERDERTGKSVPKKVGMATVARDGMDFEFSVFAEVTTDGGLTISKTRCSALSDRAFVRADVPEVARILREWLAGGAPRSARDELADAIRFADTGPALLAVAQRIAALKATDPETVRALLPVYQARKTELVDSGEVSA